LIERFYDPHEGQVTYGGKDIKGIHPESMKKYMAIV
jgi:ABC-type multidrug transport system fused ATPase/permease subunit